MQAEIQALFETFRVAAMRSLKLLALSVTLTLPGCDGDMPAMSVTVHDSAGIRIVLTPDGDVPFWSIDSVPFVDIGTVEGKDGQDLAVPWASRRLRDGRIVISNHMTNELRFYRSDGSFSKSVGGSGEGPGEFRSIAAIHLGRDDTIIVADGSLPRLNLYGPDGTFGRSVNLEPLAGRLPRLRGLLRDTIAVYRVRFYGRSRGVSRAVRDTFLVVARPLNGGRTVTIGRFLANEKFNQIMPNGSVAAWNLPFSRAFFFAVAGDLAWIGVSDTYELRGYNPLSGSLERIIRLERAITPVDNSHRQRFFEHQLATADDATQERMYRQVHRMIEFPPTMPAFGDVMNDSGQNLWVKDYNVPWDESRTTWRVFSANGVPLARVQMPEGLDVQDIGADYVLGMWVDELDVEHIRAYRLERGAL